MLIILAPLAKTVLVAVFVAVLDYSLTHEIPPEYEDDDDL